MSTLLTDLFSSGAKTRVLQVLARQAVPVSLRQVATLSDLPVRSVALALQDLTDSGVLRRRRARHRVFFRMNPVHAASALLPKIFALVEDANLQARARQYDEVAQGVVAFQKEADRLLRRAREDRKARE